MVRKFIAAGAVLLASLGAGSGAAQAASYTFTTAQSQFDAGVNNQGWWSNETDPMGFFGSSDNNENVFTGAVGDGSILRSFFTFDLSGFALGAGETLVGATFSGNIGSITTSSGGFETIGFYDVSTDAASLNNNSGISSTIFDDLGTGGIYAAKSFLPADALSDFDVALNSTFLMDAVGSQGGFLSIGGSLITIEGLPGGESVFGLSDGNSYTLRLETQISAVPLPAGLPLYGAGLGVLGFIAWRKRRKTS